MRRVDIVEFRVEIVQWRLSIHVFSLYCYVYYKKVVDCFVDLFFSIFFIQWYTILQKRLSIDPVTQKVEWYLRFMFLAECFHGYASQEIWFDSEHYCVCLFRSRSLELSIVISFFKKKSSTYLEVVAYKENVRGITWARDIQRRWS